MDKVLVIATSRQTRGGITSVIKAHESGPQWEEFHCKWIETHRDGNAIVKLWYLCTALIQALFVMPFFDIVHLHLSEMNSTLRKIIFFRMARLYRKKTIVHFHSFSTKTTIHSIYRPRYNYIFSAADKIIVLSEYWQKAICEEFGLSKEKVQILYNPCPNVSRKDNVKKTKTILYAGTVSERKGYSDMIKAFAKIADIYEDWKIVFAGNGEIDKGTKLSCELGISDRVEFLGWIDGKAKESAFRETSIFCLPSYAEGFPMAVLDAWAYGLPVITTPVGGIPDVAIDGENMLLFDPGDIDKLAIQMDKLIKDKDLMRKLIDASLSFANNQFKIETINAQLGSIYKEIGQK